jgi:hypothetical protein
VEKARLLVVVLTYLSRNLNGEHVAELAEQMQAALNACIQGCMESIDALRSFEPFG